MPDVVISYKKEDKNRVAGIAEKLRALRVVVWFDEALPNGKPFDEAIAEELSRTRCILVCWTPDALASDYVRAEAMVGHNSGRLAACILQPTPQLANMPPFNLVQYADLTDWKGQDDHEGWYKLVQRVGELTERPGLVEYARLLGQKGKAAASLATWKSRHPNDPLAQANWSETRARSTAARKTFLKHRPKTFPVTLVVATGALVVAGGALGVVWSGVLDSRKPVAPPSLPIDWKAASPPFDTSALEQTVLDAYTTARRRADVAFATAGEAKGEAEKAVRFVTEHPDTVRPLPQPIIDGFCVGPAKDNPAPVLVGAEGVYVRLECTNGVTFAGRLDPPLEAGTGIGEHHMADGHVYYGRFEGFLFDGPGVGLNNGTNFVGDFRAHAGNGYGLFYRGGELAEAGGAWELKGGEEQYGGNVVNHRLHGIGVEWSRAKQVKEFPAAGGASRGGRFSCDVFNGSETDCVTSSQ